MKQVLVKGGSVKIEETPPPGARAGCALVRVRHSLISSGTESGFVSGGGTLGYAMKKAKDPLNIEKVKRKLATVGLKGTIDVVRNKLFEFQAPGYSTAGCIVECGSGVPGFRAGDRVACAGVGYASHAEYNVVPHQLLTPIPEGVAYEEAAFVTLGAIAMQGVRRVNPTFGETVVILGLGLLGQLASQIAHTAGCHVIGCDPIAAKRDLAAEHGADLTCDPAGLLSAVNEATAGYGADAVVICAASKESAVTNQALDCCRQKGRVAVVGAVGLQLQREALYAKELDFNISCSYGPGRYQPAYEEKGLDYPIGYVRWTEGRNMAAFLRMIADKKVQVTPLISAIEPVDKAQAAYDLILGAENNAIAALLDYGKINTEKPSTRFAISRKAAQAGEVGVALLGAGAIANAFHLPNLKRLCGARLEAVVDAVGGRAKQTAEKYGAAFCATDYREALEASGVDAVLIATRHNLHKEMALAALEAGKHVFVEKPLALTLDDCEALCAAVERSGKLLTVGLNRRFAPLAQAARQAMAGVHGPKMLVYRCNAGPLPAGHWAVDPEEGGGRILGEAVHFYDWCCWFCQSDPVAVKAEKIGAAGEGVIAEDNLSTLLRFPNGDSATIIYTALGHPGLPKEQIEIYGGGGAIVVDDFMGLRIEGLPGHSMRAKRQDKGMYGLLENFIEAIRGKVDLEITAAHGLRATRIAIEALADARGKNG